MIFLGVATCWQIDLGKSTSKGDKPSFKIDNRLIEAEDAEAAKVKYRKWLNSCNVTIDSIDIRPMIT